MAPRNARSEFVPVETQGQDEERDDDLSFDDDGIFDSDGDLFDGGTDAEGVFSDQTSVFSTPRDASADHSNALTTREMEARRYEDAKPSRQLPAARAVYNQRAGFKPRPQAKRALVAKFDDQGRPLVACFQNGKQLEPFRAPTPAEFHALKTKGKIVKGGIGQTVTGSAIPWGKVAAVGGVVVAGGVAWYLWRKRKNAAAADDANAVVEEVPESTALTDDGEE